MGPKKREIARRDQVGLAFLGLVVAPMSAILFTALGSVAILIIHAIAEGLSLSSVSQFLDKIGRGSIIAMFVGSYLALLVNWIRQVRRLG